MTVIDANVFLYAYNVDAPQQPAAAQWLAKLLESGEMVALPWVTIWAFIRISTNSRIWSNPRPAREAFAIIGEWLAQPGVVALNPGPLHAEILERLVSTHGAAGPLVTDAVIAALAMEHGALLASTDQDFRRFPDVRWLNPLGDQL
jgi:toxin-antitoxin system PIN domain toxin